MKRITFSSGSVVTGDAVAAALLEYATAVSVGESSISVEVTVLEEGGEVSMRTILLGPSSQFDIADEEALVDDDEDLLFPLPELPLLGVSGNVETTDDAQRTADDVDLVMAEIEEGLGQ